MEHRLVKHLSLAEGYTQTFAEMGNELKNKISHRAVATKKLCNFILK